MANREGFIHHKHHLGKPTSRIRPTTIKAVGRELRLLPQLMGWKGIDRRVSVRVFECSIAVFKYSTFFIIIRISIIIVLRLITNALRCPQKGESAGAPTLSTPENVLQYSYMRGYK